MKTSKIGFLLSYLCMASIAATVISPALPTIAQDFGVSLKAINSVNSLFLLGYMLGQLIYGPIANRFGRLMALRSGILLMGLGIFVTILGSKMLNFDIFVLGRFLTALGAASGLTCTFMLLIELLSEKQSAKAMAFGPMFFTIGIGSSAFVGGWLSQNFTWQASNYFLLIYACIMYGGSYLFKETLQKTITLNLKNLFQGYAKALRSPQLILFSFCVGLVSLFAYGYTTAAPIYAAQFLKLNALEYGKWNLVNMLGMSGSSLLGAYLIPQIGHRKLLNFGLIGLVMGLAGLIMLQLNHITSPALFFTITTWMYLASGVIFPAGSYFATHAIEDKASASSIMSCINIGTAFFGLILFGFLPFNLINSLIILLGIGVMFCLLLTNTFFSFGKAKGV